MEGCPMRVTRGLSLAIVLGLLPMWPAAQALEPEASLFSSQNDHKPLG